MTNGVDQALPRILMPRTGADRQTPRDAEAGPGFDEALGNALKSRPGAGVEKADADRDAPRFGARFGAAIQRIESFGRRFEFRLPERGQDDAPDAPLPDGNWDVVSASALPWADGNATPREISRSEMDEITAQFGLPLASKINTRGDALQDIWLGVVINTWRHMRRAGHARDPVSNGNPGHFYRRSHVRSTVIDARKNVRMYIDHRYVGTTSVTTTCR